MIKVALSAWMDTPFKKDLSTQGKMTALQKPFSIPNYLFSVPCSHSACWHFIISIFPDNVSVWCATRWTVASLIEWATAHSCQPSPQRYSNISGHSVVTTIIVKLTSYYDVLPGRVSPTPSAARGSADLSSMGKQSQTSIRHQSNGSTKSCAVNHGRLPAEKNQSFPPCTGHCWLFSHKYCLGLLPTVNCPCETVLQIREHVFNSDCYTQRHGFDLQCSLVSHLSARAWLVY